ncbi:MULTISPECIES: YndM family protein [Neobacillus]|uniref:YndM family protein n=1 Tax=Neobacillus citreus TaxID=2833578 RepID=A0A942SU72_9BACI|nr:YndM family protein [Neobacillus citreus]MCH6265537.1 YndM family protein [Neobacillus citreus]
MQNVYRLAAKFIPCLIILGIILGLFFDFSFGDVLLITAVLGIVSYVVGDLLILRKTTNLLATVADFLVTFLVVWLMGRMLTNENNLIWASFISAAAVALFEYFYHGFLTNEKNKQFTNTSRPIQQQPHFQTEAAEEFTPVKPDVRSSDENK